MRKNWILTLFFLLSIFFIFTYCDSNSGGGSGEGSDPETENSWNYAGSVWSYEIKLSYVMPNTKDTGDFSELIYSINGSFTIPQEPNTAGNDYSTEELAPDTIVSYTQTRWLYEELDCPDSYCTSKTGISDISPAQGLTAIYYHNESIDGEAVVSNPFTGTDTIQYEHAIQLILLPNDAYYSSLGSLVDVNGKYTYMCHYWNWDYLAEECIETTEEEESVPPVAWITYYGELKNGTGSWFFEDSEASFIGTVTFSCISGCHPPEPEEPEKECDEEEIQNDCDAFKENALRLCQQLDDWMLVESTPGGTIVTCATSDCSDAMSMHESSDPFTSVTYQVDLACDSSDYSCSVECYGWGEQ